MSDPGPIFEIHERQSRFIEERYEDIEPGEGAWLVKGILPAVGLAYIAGPSKAGKSFVAIDWSLRITSGQKVMDRRTEQGAIVYFAAEDAYGLRLRTRAWRKDSGYEETPFSLFAQSPRLQDITEFEDVEQTILAVADRRTEEGFPLRAVVFDTFAQSAPGIDENSAKDVTPILARLAEMAVRLNCLVIVIAHTGKDETRGIRGWSGQLGNSDAVIMVDRKGEDDGASERTLLLDKVKNGPDGSRWSFDLMRVDLGKDKDGDPVTSCVPEYRDFVKRKAGTAGQTARDKLILTAFYACVEAGQMLDVPPCPGVPFGTRGVLRESIKDRLIDTGYSGSDDNQDAVKRRINRDILRLVQNGDVKADPDMVWVPQPRSAVF